MANVYNPQWQRMMDVDAALMRRMRADNFQPQHTGGGCMSWERLTDDNGYIWITDQDGASLGAWADRNKRQWIIGRYNSEADFISLEHVTLFQALKHADSLRAPVADEQTIISALDYRED